MTIDAAILVPHSVEAEEAFLGSILINPYLVGDFIGRLEPDDFFIVRNAWVWESMLALVKRGQGIDYLTVVEELKTQGHLEEIGGAAYVTLLLNNTPSSLYAETYAEFLLNQAYRRRIMTSASYLAEQALSDHSPVEIQERVDALAMRLRESLPRPDAYLKGRHAQDTYETLIAQRMAQKTPKTLSLYLMDLHEFVPVIKQGKMIVISGFTGQGKTILMEEQAEWCAMLGFRCLYMTTELSIEDHLDRRYVRFTGLPYEVIVDPSDEVKEQIEAARSEMTTWQDNIDFYELGERNLTVLLAQMRRAYQHGTRVFFIDYLTEAVARDKNELDEAIFQLHAFAKAPQTRSWLFVASQQTPTESGPRTYGTRVLEFKNALWLRMEREEKAKEDSQITAGGKTFVVAKGEPSPVMRIHTSKATYGVSGRFTEAVMDGQRFRLLEGFTRLPVIDPALPKINRRAGVDASHWSDQDGQEILL